MGRCAPRSAGKENLKTLLRIVVAICAVVAVLELALHYPYGQKQTQGVAQAQQHQAPLSEGQRQGQSEHQHDLDNRADLLGVEQDFMRGATNFNDPGYRDLPNAAQMQFSSEPAADSKN
jgi:hypothetical protein